MHTNNLSWSNYPDVQMSRPTGDDGACSALAHNEDETIWHAEAAKGQPVAHKVGNSHLEISVSWGHKETPKLVYHVSHFRR